MSRNDEPITPGVIRLAAEQTVRQHEPGGNIWRPGTCWHCTADGCAQLRWAVGVLDGGEPAYQLSVCMPTTWR